VTDSKDGSEANSSSLNLKVLIPKHKEEATDDIREKGERG
jgi:hypothetical protein